VNLKFGDSLREGMSRDPQINSSNYILNIVELQNVVTNASGLTPLGVLTNTVGQIQEMIDYDNKRININTIAKFSEPTVPISLINDLNLCNSALYSNGIPFQGGSGDSGTTILNFLGGTGIGIGSTSILLTSTSISGGPLISLNIGGSNIFNVGSNGNVSFYNPILNGGQFLISSTAVLGIASNAGLGKSLMCMDTGGNAGWGYVSTLASGTGGAITFSGPGGEVARLTSAGNMGIGVLNPVKTLDVNGTGQFTGRLTAFDFLTLSDRRYKTNITRIENASDILSKIHGVRFVWRDLSSCDVGVIAQDLQRVLPEAVVGSEEWVEGEEEPKLSVAYHKITPVLVEVVKGLEARISALERQNITLEGLIRSHLPANR